jgi:capsular exopolysaccharide synthesis family protein
MAVAQHEAVLGGAAPAPPAPTSPEIRRRIDEETASLRALVARRDRIAMTLKIAPASVERVDAASGAKLVSAPLLLMAGAGLVVGLLAAAAREAMVTTIRVERDIRRTLNLPILGVVPRDPGDAVEEVYATMAALLDIPAPPGPGRVFGMASAVPGEGKSTVAAGLASAFARASVRVLLVDADLRRPAQHARFGVPNESGLSSFLTGATGAVDSAIVPTDTENLSLLPSGPPLEMPIPYLRSERFHAMVADFRGRFDVVILDLPPVCRAADALFAAPLADGMILVVAAGESRKDDVTLAKRLVRSVKGTWSGCVLNKAAERPLGYYYYGPAASADAGA